MQNWNVAVDNNSFDSAGITKDCQDAICEYIWNGFEAQATNVSVNITGGDLKTPAEITIHDNGTGINHDSLHDTFGAFLSSQKKYQGIRIKTQTNKGKGRFSYTSFSNSAEWNTTYTDKGNIYNYKIQLNSLNKANVQETELANVTGTTAVCGTIVTIPLNEAQAKSDLSFEKMRKKLLGEFSWYLYLNKPSDIELFYCGNKLSYDEYIDKDISKHLDIVINNNKFCIDVIVWKNRIENSSKVYYVNDHGEITEAENTQFNKNSVNFYHGVFVKSKYFSDFPTLIGSDDATIIEHTAGQKDIMRQLRKNIRYLIDETLHDFLLPQADKYLSDMEQKSNLPIFPSDDFGVIKKKDFLNVTKELFCTEPRIFYKLKDRQTKSLLGFIALLLDSDERENILSVVEQVVELNTDQRKKFAFMLKQTKLVHMIETIDAIQQRYQVVQELREIVYNKDVSKFANERDHIQKIVESHYWLFGDQYSLVTADVTIRHSLIQFESILNLDDAESVLSPVDLRQRMDVFLYGGRMNEIGEKEGLVIELKSPSVTLTPSVLSQIERYANIIRREPQFSGQKRIWRFFAICSCIDDDVKSKYSGYASHGKLGLASIVGNFEIFALTWDDIFLSFEQRYRFLLEKLRNDFEQEHDTTNESSIDRSYVTDKVGKLIGLQVVNCESPS